MKLLILSLFNLFVKGKKYFYLLFFKLKMVIEFLNSKMPHHNVFRYLRSMRNVSGKYFSDLAPKRNVTIGFIYFIRTFLILIKHCYFYVNIVFFYIHYYCSFCFHHIERNCFCIVLFFLFFVLLSLGITMLT